MDNTKSLRSQALDLLRFPLACVVVTIHVFAGKSFVIHGVETDLSQYDGLMAIFAFGKVFLAGQSVPIYFFIAGYVFFLGVTLTKATYLKKMRNRFKSLLIPYLLWNVIGIMLVLLKFLPALHRFFPGCDISDLHFTPESVMSCFWNYSGSLTGREAEVASQAGSGSFPIDVSMWFVRDLMIVALFSPVIHLMLRRFGMMLPAIAGMVWFCVSDLDLGHFYQLLMAVFFFSLGAYFSFHRRDMVAEFRRYRVVSYYVYVLSALYLLLYTYVSGSVGYVVQNGFAGTEMIFVKNVTIVTGLFAAYNLALDLIEKRGVRPSATLASASFFIYAGHCLLLGYVEKILSLVMPPVNELNAVAMYLSTDVTLCVGLLALYVGMRRYLPRVLSPLIGGRL